MKKEIKHHCADNMHYSDEKGKCVISSLEKSAPNLRFKKSIGPKNAV